MDAKKFDETIKSLIPVNVGRVKMQWNGKWQNQEFPVVPYFVKINETLHLLDINNICTFPRLTRKSEI